MPCKRIHPQINKRVHLHPLFFEQATPVQAKRKDHPKGGLLRDRKWDTGVDLHFSLHIRREKLLCRSVKPSRPTVHRTVGSSVRLPYRPKGKTTQRVVFPFGAGYGSRTRLHGLGSRCITDIRILHRVGIIAKVHGKFNLFLPQKSTFFDPLTDAL